jgi:hypothetical protein
MEYEHRFWVNSYLPTGYRGKRPQSNRPKAIPDTSIPYLETMISEGKNKHEIARAMGCSVWSVQKAIKSLRK